jgi:hypothetical protein
MPVQIQELIVRAVVNEQGAPSAEKTTPLSSDLKGGLKKEEIVQECVEIVLELLNIKNQR